MSRLFPGPVARLAVEDIYEELAFPALGERPYVFVNMVASLDGKASAGGKASPIGSRTDRTVMRYLRAAADAVMVGAGTLRAEKLTLAVPEDLAEARVSRGRKAQPWGVVAAGASGDVPLGALTGPPPDDLVVLVPAGKRGLVANLQLRAAVEEVAPKDEPSGGRLLDLELALGILKARYGVDALLVEGGPALNQALLAAGLVDEVFLTLAPKLIGGEAPEQSQTILEGPTLPGGERPATLVSAHLSDGGELFLRYSLRG